jgi:diadenosine tetraphosphate (Ap4A) HIT family hydrolase
MNATARKFGDPDSRIARYGSWLVLVRPRQVTIGSLVAVCTEPVTAFGDLSAHAFADLGHAVAAMERGLKRAFSYDRLNYLMLMLVDPDVHFHIVPRYARPVAFVGQEFPDHDWPGPPDVTRGVLLEPPVQQALMSHLKGVWS